VLREAFDHRAGARRIAEDVAPLLVGEVRGDDDRACLVLTMRKSRSAVSESQGT